MRKKYMVKRLAGVLLLCFLLTALGGCGGSGDGKASGGEASATGEVNTEGFPIVKEPIQLKFVGMQTPVQADLNEIKILKQFEEKSGIDIEWTCVPAEFVSERRNIMMASGEGLPDAFFKMQFSAPEVSKYGSQGMFIPMNDLIDAYAPNIKATLDEWADVKAGLTMPNGNIYSLGYVLAATPITSGVKFFFNQEALDMAKQKLPTTLEEFADVLRAFKDLDYNGNGQNDEVPYTNSDPTSLDALLKGSFGLGTRGNGHPYVDMDPKTNALRFLPATEEYKAMWQYLADLYQEGLIDQELFTMDMPKLIAKGEEGRALSYSFVNHSIIGTAYSAKSVGLSQPLAGDSKYGEPIAATAGSALSGVGNFVITKDNKHPEATMRWADYWFSDEGIREYFMGIEGETYEVTADGSYEYNDFVMHNPDGIMFEQVLGSYVPWAGGANPSIANEKYFKGGEMQGVSKESAMALEKYRPKIIWPGFLWDEADNDDMLTIKTDLDTYINENRALFLTGKRSFDEWDDYVKGFDNMQLKRFMEIYENTYKRYEPQS
jgi:putative aldouronate transport system substrate-binding protein